MNLRILKMLSQQTSLSSNLNLIKLNSPNNLKRQGWVRNSLRSGEKVKVRIAPLRNGKHGGLFLDLTKPDGKVLDSGLPKDGTPINVPQL